MNQWTGSEKISNLDKPLYSRVKSTRVFKHSATCFLHIWMNIQNLISVSINLMAIDWGYTVPHGTPLLHVITHFQTNHLHVCRIFFMAFAWRSQICSCENTSSGCGKGGRRSDLEASRIKTSGLIWTCWGKPWGKPWETASIPYGFCLKFTIEMAMKWGISLSSKARTSLHGIQIFV